MSPIGELQTALVAALAGDAELVGLIGAGGVFDAPPVGADGPFIAITRHDVVARDGDLAPGHEHRLALTVWHPDASRASLTAISTLLVAVATAAELSGPALNVVGVDHLRTDTDIDTRTGAARAIVRLRAFSEPA